MNYPTGKLSLALASALVAGCTYGGDRCAMFPSEAVYSDRIFYELRDAVINDQLRSAMSDIEYCYDQNPYEERQFRLSFDSARMDDSGRILLIYEFVGLSDARVAFLISKRGVVEQAYRFSAL